MKIIALLPMKGHSERVPNKNMRLFNGLPLFHVILKKLIDIEEINKVVIDTDSDIIAQSASTFGEKVTVLKRPDRLLGDFVSMNEIIRYDLENSDGDIYIQTHSTNPLLTEASIKKAIQLFGNNKNKFDSIFSVNRHQARFYDTNFNPINHKPSELLRTQDLPPLYEENSSFYVFTKDSFYQNGDKRIGKHPYLFEIEKLESVDIDEEEDFILAELIHKSLNRN